MPVSSTPVTVGFNRCAFRHSLVRKRDFKIKFTKYAITVSLHMCPVIPGCCALAIMMSHVEYTFPVGQLEEFVGKKHLKPKKPRWISVDCTDSGTHLMAVDKHHILSFIL